MPQRVDNYCQQRREYCLDWEDFGFLAPAANHRATMWYMFLLLELILVAMYADCVWKERLVVKEADSPSKDHIDIYQHASFKTKHVSICWNLIMSTFIWIFMKTNSSISRRYSILRSHRVNIGRFSSPPFQQLDVNPNQTHSTCINHFSVTDQLISQIPWHSIDQGYYSIRDQSSSYFIDQYPKYSKPHFFPMENSNPQLICK